MPSDKKSKRKVRSFTLPEEEMEYLRNQFRDIGCSKGISKLIQLHKLMTTSSHVVRVGNVPIDKEIVKVLHE